MQLIIPALDEARRLPSTLAALQVFVVDASEALGPVEVVVVDNASTDATAEVARSFDIPTMPVRVVHCGVRGKGAAVRAGVAATTHDRVAFMDADGATHFDALVDGDRLLDAGADMAIGSRALADSVTVERHSKVRTVGAGVYRDLTRRVAPGITDTQCGFKMMRGDLAREVFPQLRCRGFSFDVELVGRFQRNGARVVEFPVVWVDKPGSTFVPARHGVASFLELGSIAWRLRGLQPASPLPPAGVRPPTWWALAGPATLPSPVLIDEAIAEA